MSKRQQPTRETIETYDRSAEFFRREWSTASMEDKLTRFRLALHRGGRRVFDAGCGSGRDMHWLLERDLQVVGGRSVNGSAGYRISQCTRWSIRQPGSEGIAPRHCQL